METIGGGRGGAGGGTFSVFAVTGAAGGVGRPVVTASTLAFVLPVVVEAFTAGFTTAFGVLERTGALVLAAGLVATVVRAFAGAREEERVVRAD